jgi:alkylhydroperoxidase family enzyme
MPGFSTEVEDVGNSVHQGPNAGQLQRSRLNWLEMLDKHSTDHRAGVACPTCFTHAGMRVEDVRNTEEVIPSCNLMELAPSMSSKERELLQYFEKFTSQNLALCETLWRTVVLRSAWQVRFSFCNILHSSWLTPPSSMTLSRALFSSSR